jgi:hypothetical protein
MANLTQVTPLSNLRAVQPSRIMGGETGIAQIIPQTAAQQAVSLIQEFGNATDLVGRELSYGNGQTNILGMRLTGMNIRLRAVNGTSSDRKIYILPTKLLGVDVPVGSSPEKEELMNWLGLDSNAIPFFAGEVEFEEENEEEELVTKKFKITSLNSFQTLKFLASMAAFEPFNITGVSMRSFNELGQPENSNYGNGIVHYNVSPWLETRRSGQLNFSDFQTSRDFSTEIVKIDFVNQGFVAPVSQADVLELLVNANTRMDITLHVGARASGTELFFRDIQGGTDLLLNNFDGSVVNNG